MSNWQLSEEAYNLLLQRVDEIKELVAKQNGRIGDLEIHRAKAIGITIAVSVIVPIIVSAIVAKLLL